MKTLATAALLLSSLAFAGVAPGAAAPDFKLKDADGKTVSLSDFKGKVVVLNFWASWCEPCQTEAPLLEHAQPKLERHGATVLGVTYQDNAPDSEGFVRHYHLTYPVLRDITSEFASSYGTHQVPESFIINRQGRVVAISRGEIEQGFVNQALALATSS